MAMRSAKAALAFTSVVCHRCEVALAETSEHNPIYALRRQFGSNVCRRKCVCRPSARARPPGTARLLLARRLPSRAQCRDPRRVISAPLLLLLFLNF